MKSIKVFNKYYKEYEEWFEKNKNIYLSELKVLKSFIPDGLEGIEIGVGSGRFAQPLVGIKVGVEPSTEMAKIAKSRGIDVINAYAEDLPLSNNSFDFAMMVTTICFVFDPEKALKEVYRIIKKGGFVLVGYVPLDSHLGKLYSARKEKSKFYKEAHFYTKSEVKSLLQKAGFSNLTARQTIFEYKNDLIQDYVDGDDKGGFVVVKGEKIQEF